jgi:hypothetical protein
LETDTTIDDQSNADQMPDATGAANCALVQKNAMPLQFGTCIASAQRQPLLCRREHRQPGLASDYVVADSNTTCRAAFGSIGLMPDLGLLW